MGLASCVSSVMVDDNVRTLADMCAQLLAAHKYSPGLSCLVLEGRPEFPVKETQFLGGCGCRWRKEVRF